MSILKYANFKVAFLVFTKRMPYLSVIITVANGDILSAGDMFRNKRWRISSSPPFILSPTLV